MITTILIIIGLIGLITLIRLAHASGYEKGWREAVEDMDVVERDIAKAAKQREIAAKEQSEKWVESLNNMGYGKIASLKNAGEEKKGIFLGTTKDFSVAELNKLDLLNMEKNEIKKALYKQNPKAEFKYARKGNLYYDCGIDGKYITFEIPISDLGDATFLYEMDAKLLIRWMV